MSNQTSSHRPENILQIENYVKRAANSASFTPYHSDRAPIPNGITESTDMPPSDDLTDAKLRVTAAETDTKIARLEGKLDTLTATIVGKLDAVSEKMSADHEYNRTTRWVMVGLAIAICAVMVGMATYGDALFGRGMNVRDVVNAVVREQQDASKRLEPATKHP